MKKYTVYQITNLLDSKIYIGKHETYNLCDGYMGSGKHLKRAQSKHGLDNFKKEILYIFDTEQEMNAKEAELVTEEFCLREDTYNICPGGKGGWGYINKNCENSFKGRSHTKETLEKMSVSKRNKPVSQSTRQKLSKIMKNRVGESNNFFNKNHSEEARQQISKSKQNKVTAFDLESKLKITVESSVFHSSSNLIGIRKAKKLGLI